LSISGPNDGAEVGSSPSLARIVGDVKLLDSQAAQTILTRLLRLAWRRPVTSEDGLRFLPFFEQGQANGGFYHGIEAALSALLVSREFLFRVETAPPAADVGKPYAISNLELASRLSFFLWSSLPDEALLAAAEQGNLTTPETLTAQTSRMLADKKASALVLNFAGQWLHLRNMEAATPDTRLFPDFDDNLRQAMRQETELLFNDVLREDASVLTLLKMDHLWLNERLAKHYGIPYVYGSHFRKVPCPSEAPRGGILRHGSLLTLTSYATRTSPVVRGKWILENLLGTPPQPPAPDVPALDNSVIAESLPIRQRLAAHRDKPACAGCHAFIDPPGFALENFDAIGRWRELEAEQPVDANGGLPDGAIFTGVQGLEDGLLGRPELFVMAMTEKLLTYALGRGITPQDGPVIRKIVRQSAAKNNQFSALIQGIVNSPAFLMSTKL
jgi:hypothetical protein